MNFLDVLMDSRGRKSWTKMHDGSRGREPCANLVEALGTSVRGSRPRESLTNFLYELMDFKDVELER